jgi:hypothetical protein
MNRIYQGRVSSVEIPKPGAKNEWTPLDPDPKLAKQKAEDALWQPIGFRQSAGAVQTQRNVFDSHYTAISFFRKFAHWQTRSPSAQW